MWSCVRLLVDGWVRVVRRFVQLSLNQMRAAPSPGHLAVRASSVHACAALYPHQNLHTNHWHVCGFEGSLPQAGTSIVWGQEETCAVPSPGCLVAARLLVALQWRPPAIVLKGLHKNCCCIATINTSTACRVLYRASLPQCCAWISFDLC
jgi:hypothetical protein